MAEPAKETTTNILNLVIEQQAGRKILETQDFIRDGVRISLWGLQDGHTMIVRRKKRQFLCFEESSSSIGVVAAQFRH